MWCRNCNIETNEKNCPICGHVTEEDIPIEVMWCPKCRTPIVRAVNDQAKYFNTHIGHFIEANKDRLHYLKDEAFSFVRRTAEKFDEERTIV